MAPTQLFDFTKFNNGCYYDQSAANDAIDVGLCQQKLYAQKWAPHMSGLNAYNNVVLRTRPQWKPTDLVIMSFLWRSEKSAFYYCDPSGIWTMRVYTVRKENIPSGKHSMSYS